MAILYDTTLVPSKLDLLTSWLPAQPWYLGSGDRPELATVGGFRLDDPEGEVGVQFMVVTDRSVQPVTTYQVPLTYRPSACAAAGDGLIGTAEHGILGHRWIYDGAHDPVFVAQLVALIQGDAEAQSQRESNTPDATVISQAVTSRSLAVTESAVVADGPHGTDVLVRTTDADGTLPDSLMLHVHRRLQPGGAPGGRGGGWGYVAAPWQLADDSRVRSVFVTARYL